MSGIIFSEGSGVNDSIFGKSQAPIRLFLEKRGEAFEQESVVKHLFAMNDSKNYGEKYTSLTAMDGFKAVGENGAYPMDEMREGNSKIIENVTWKDSFKLSQEIVEDSKLMDLKKRPANFITGYYRTREKFGAALYGGAIKAANSTKFAGVNFDLKCADGKTLFNADHKALVKGDAQSNVFTDAFSVDALGAMETAMQNFRGDNGEILDVAPDTILIPNIFQLKRDVFAAVGADKDPNTANNGFNYQFGRWNIIVWSYLNQFITAGTSPWVMLDSKYNETYGGAVWQDRIPLTVKSDIDPNTDANIWRGRSRFNAGFVDWRFAALGGAATGDMLLGEG